MIDETVQLLAMHVASSNAGALRTIEYRSSPVLSQTLTLSRFVRVKGTVRLVSEVMLTTIDLVSIVVYGG